MTGTAFMLCVFLITLVGPLLLGCESKTGTGVLIGGGTGVLIAGAARG